MAAWLLLCLFWATHMSSANNISTNTPTATLPSTTITANTETSINISKCNIKINTSMCNMPNSRSLTCEHELWYAKLVPVWPWSNTCEENTKEKDQKVCKPCQILTEEYLTISTLLNVLLMVMAISGMLAVLSNSVVIFIGLKVNKELFDPAVISLACTELLNGLICTPIIISIYYFKHTKPENGCEDWLKCVLKSDKINLYKYKWVLPNIVKASICWHVFYIAACRLHRLRTGRTASHSSWEALRLALIYAMAILISSVTFFAETGTKNHCCKLFPLVEVWLTIALPILCTLGINLAIYRISSQSTEGAKRQFGTIRNRNKKAMEMVLMVGPLLVFYSPLIVKWHFCGYNSFVWSLLSQTLVATHSFMNAFIYAFQVEEFQNILIKYMMPDLGLVDLNRRSPVALRGISSRQAFEQEQEQGQEQEQFAMVETAAGNTREKEN